MDRHAAQGDLQHQAVAMAIQHRPDRYLVKVQRVVYGLLPAIGRDTLAEVALRVDKTHPDKGQTEIADLFAVIAGEHTQPAGVDGQRTMQAELGGKVGDRPLAGVGMLLAEPQVPVVQVGLKAGPDPVVLRHKLRILGQDVQPFGTHQLQHADRIVPGTPPQGVVDRLEQVAGRRAPTPPKIVSQVRQMLDAVRNRYRRVHRSALLVQVLGQAPIPQGTGGRHPAGRTAVPDRRGQPLPPFETEARAVGAAGSSVRENETLGK